MRGGAFLSDRKLTAGGIAVALTTVIASSPSAFGAERVVLGEYFTWLNCPACAVAGPVVNNMVNLYGADGTDPQRSGTLALVEYNLWDQYEVLWGTLRQGFYNAIFSGTPCFVHDGIYDAWPIETYVSKFLNRQSVPTTVTVSITAEETSPNRYEVNVETCLEPGAAAVDLRIYTIMAEDYFPPTYWYDRNGFRSAAPTSDISLAPGECAQVTNQFIILPGWQLSNMKILAWAQQPNSHWPANVYQAGIDAYPFEAPTDPCPYDCDDSGDVGITDFLTMLSDWGGPSPCDFDGGGVGITDFLDLLAHWGPCP
jgi:hypothetical protein